MADPLVSVMMPAFNAEPYIGAAIESLLAQRYPNWELIIVNDGSTDGTARVVARYSDPRIRVIHQSNQGESAARNAALGQMQGELVAFLDADDLFLPAHLELTVAYLRAHPHEGGVYTDGYHCDPAGNWLQSLASRRRGPFRGMIFEEVVRASDVFGPPTCVLLRRTIIQRHALTFDPEIVIGPDWDFLTRYAEVARFGYIDQATCLYRVHQTNVTLRIEARRRALSLARCREKAIGLSAFDGCGVETRAAVFYDLLVNLLVGFPDRQEAISHLPSFTALPASEQARLLRLMAGGSLLAGQGGPRVEGWLARARQLHPADRRGALLYTLCRWSPALCRLLLRARRAAGRAREEPGPFGQLGRAALLAFTSCLGPMS